MLKSTLAAAVLAALAASYSPAYAATAPQAQSPQDTSAAAAQTAPVPAPPADEKSAQKLQAVTVTGSLIPQTEIETATPVIQITAEDMKSRGFTSVAQALQQASFSTGSVQGAQTSASFTQGAQTMSMFGLPVGFVKYLVDGRPMGNFPALYNGSDAFNNLSGIPMDMVDHIDVLPGGQSSLYGSDAIAGVVNIVLKKHIDAPSIDVRYGMTSDGGGASGRVSGADSFSFDDGKINILVGGQFEKVNPIWGYQRDLTKQYYTEGTGPAVASRDYLVISGTGAGYLFEDPNNCSNVTSQFGGTEAKQHRTNSGDYCGSFNTPGYRTLQNDQKTANLYTHATFDVSSNLQLYGDVLYNYQEQKSNVGSSYNWWGTSADYGYFFDPTLGNGGDFVQMQRAFSPEDVGGYNRIMDKNTENSYMLSLGGKGTIGESDWEYDVGFTHSDDKLLERGVQRLSGPIDAYFEQHVLGPQQGTASGYPVFTPDYGAFYTPMSPSDFDSFTARMDSRSKTWDNMLRGQLTNASLFSMPGGDAGIAVVVEGGNQGWDYSPDERLLDGEVWGKSSVQGSGHRSRAALTTEMKFPLLSQLTLDVAGRYDDYKVDGEHINHGTYNLGLEYRPFESLLLRGRYGTAFKVPTLADEFQGKSGYYSFVTDYANCARLGFSGANVADCPQQYGDVQFSGEQAGSTELQPITAKVWSYGFVWAPVARMSFSMDYLHWDIDNEVNQESANSLSLTQYQCDSGAMDPNSETCLKAAEQITRGTPLSPDLLGPIQSIYTPKVNVSNEQVNAITANFNFSQPIGAFGNLLFAASYSDVLDHTQQSYPSDPTLDLLKHPGYSTDFTRKINASLTWSLDKWSATVYGNRYGRTPNYLAQYYDSYDAPGAGKVSPWVLYNASVTYNPIQSLGLSLMVNNLFNEMPPEDHSYPGTTGEPYNSSNYNVYGRAIYLEANYKFGLGSN